MHLFRAFRDDIQTMSKQTLPGYIRLQLLMYKLWCCIQPTQIAGICLYAPLPVTASGSDRLSKRRATPNSTTSPTCYGYAWVQGDTGHTQQPSGCNTTPQHYGLASQTTHESGILQDSKAPGWQQNKPEICTSRQS